MALTKARSARRRKAVWSAGGSSVVQNSPEMGAAHFGDGHLAWTHAGPFCSATERSWPQHSSQNPCPQRSERSGASASKQIPQALDVAASSSAASASAALTGSPGSAGSAAAAAAAVASHLSSEGEARRRRSGRAAGSTARAGCPSASRAPPVVSRGRPPAQPPARQSRPPPSNSTERFEDQSRRLVRAAGEVDLVRETRRRGWARAPPAAASAPPAATRSAARRAPRGAQAAREQERRLQGLDKAGEALRVGPRVVGAGGGGRARRAR